MFGELFFLSFILALKNIQCVYIGTQNINIYIFFFFPF